MKYASFYLAFVMTLTISAEGATGEVTPAEMEKLGLVENNCGESRTGGVFESKSQGVCLPEMSPFQALEQLSKNVEQVLAPRNNDIACVAAAQKIFSGEASSFRSCPSGEAITKMPCRSMQKARADVQALDLVSECLDMNRRDLFRLTGQDSGFISGALSATSESSIREVQGVENGLIGGSEVFEFSKKLREKVNAKSFCSNLQRMETDFALSSSSEICSRMNLPESGFLSLYFRAKSFLYLKSEAEAFAEKHGLKSKFGKDYSDVILAIAYAGSGPAGSVKALSTFEALSRVKFSGKDSFLSKFRMTLLATAPASLRKDVEKFDEHTKNFYQQAKAAVGGRECF